MLTKTIYRGQSTLHLKKINHTLDLKTPSLLGNSNHFRSKTEVKPETQDSAAAEIIFKKPNKNPVCL